MEIGLFSESGARGNPWATTTYDQDLREIVLADELGYPEIWVAERGSRSRGQAPDIVSAANLLICKAAAFTRQIRLGTGIRPLPYHHPFTVATEANVCDHLTGGRYMLGYGGTHGLYGDHNLQLGIEAERQRAMTYEAVEYIVKCFTCEDPFDWDGEYWHGKGINVLPKSVQQPHVPMAAACSGAPETIEVAAKRGFAALFGRGGDPPGKIRQMGDLYTAYTQAAGRAPSRRPIRAAHHVYVSTSARQALSELQSFVVPWLDRVRRGAHVDVLSRWLPEGGSLDDISFEMLVDAGYYMVGDPDTVAERITQHYWKSEGFGTLLLITGQGHTSEDLWHRSLRLIAEQVAPQLRDLDPDRDFPQPATPSALGARQGP